MRAYEVDLSKAGDVELVTTGPEVTALTVLDIPPGAVIVIKVAGGTQLLPLYFRGQVIRLCPGVTDGITATVPSGLAGVLLVGVDTEADGIEADAPQLAELALYDASISLRDNGLAGSFPRVQLQNPATNTRRLYVVEVEAQQIKGAMRGSVGVTTNFKGAALPGAIQKRTPAAPAATAVVTWTSDGGAPDRSSGADGNSDNVYGLLSWTTDPVAGALNVTRHRRFRPPLVLLPGEALSAESASTASSGPLSARFTWFER